MAAYSSLEYCVSGAAVSLRYLFKSSLCRATKNRGEDAHTDGKFNLSQKGCMEIMKLFFCRD